MTSRKDRGRQWSAFEKHTLMCLISRGLHITGFQEEDEEVVFGRNFISTKTKRRRTTKKVKDSRHAYMDVATALNRSLNSGSYAEDIPINEVTAMIDQVSNRD